MRVKVSVVMAIYNAQDFLRECLDSVIGQTLEEIEIICVNDGSTDNTLAILQEYAKTDDRLIIIDQSNQGAGAARNAGLSIARGEYLSFLDADDFFEKDMLKVAYDAAITENADVCVFAADHFNNITQNFEPCSSSFRRQFIPEKQPFNPKEENARDNIYRMFNGWAWDKLFKSEYIKKMGLQFQNLRTTNDMFFVFTGLACAKKVVTVDKILVHQRIEVKTSLSRTREKSWDCFYHGLVAMQEHLKEYGLYRVYEKAFVNWALNFSLWQLNTMSGDAFKKTYQLLHCEAFDRFDISIHHHTYFYSQEEYKQFLKLYTTPLNRYLSEN